MNRRDTLLHLLAWPVLASANEPDTPTLAESDATALRATDLLADAAVLRRAYEALHPGLLRYNTPAQMAGHVHALNRLLSRDQPVSEAYLAFSIFAAKLRCGHTYANFFNQSDRNAAALFQRSDRLPLHFVWLGGRMIVLRNFSTDPAIVPGTQVLTLDGIPVARILEKLMTVARADGGNDAKRVAWLSVKGYEPVEAFDVFLPLFFPHIGARQTLQVRAPGASTVRSTTVDALTAARRRDTRLRPTDGEGPLWTLDTSRSDRAVLLMPTWAMYNTRWDWKTWLQQAFETLARDKVPALVIDLRANEGGDDVGDAVLAHLVDEPLRLDGSRRLVRYRKIPDDLAPFLDTWDRSFKDWGDAAVPVDERFYRLTRYDDDAGGNRVLPQAPRYRGRVFVLIAATNSSATFSFAQRVRQARLGTLVGQPTGGNLRGINGGAFFFVRLPHSGIELDLPLIGYFPDGPLPPDRGLDPDVMVVPSVEDIAAGRDAEMGAVERLLRA